MQTTITCFGSYDVCALTGEMKINELPTFSPHFHRYTLQPPTGDLVFDLTELTFLDSAGIRVLINLHKRFAAVGKTVYLFKPIPAIAALLQNVNLDKVFSFIDSFESLQKNIAETSFTPYLPFTKIENEIRRVSVNCAACGSSDTIGYLIDPQDYEWHWNVDDPFPFSSTKDTQKNVDIQRMLPIVCLECFTCSIEVSHFAVYVDGKLRIPSKLDEQSKIILNKGIKKRKKMAENIPMAAIKFFGNPRDNACCLLLYQLAETCAHAMAVTKISANPFTIGYLNYCAIKYAPTEMRPDLINNCRTWLYQVIEDKKSYSVMDLARTYFIMINVSLNVDKMKDAAQCFRDFQELMGTIPANIPTEGITSPHFWFGQAQAIWQKEIKNRSSELG